MRPHTASILPVQSLGMTRTPAYHATLCMMVLKGFVVNAFLLATMLVEGLPSAAQATNGPPIWYRSAETFSASVPTGTVAELAHASGSSVRLASTASCLAGTVTCSLLTNAIKRESFSSSPPLAPRSLITLSENSELSVASSLLLPAPQTARMERLRFRSREFTPRPRRCRAILRSGRFSLTFGESVCH